MTTVFDQFLAGVRADINAREARLSFQDIKALSASVPPPRDALGVLLQRGCGVIAEIKRATPAKGTIAWFDSPKDVAVQFEAGGAQVISCHTGRHGYGGSFQDLDVVKSAVGVPVMCKDLIIDPYQVHEARYFGADMVALVASVLDQSRLESLLDRVESLGMTALVEVHTTEDATRAISAGARVVGINARNAHTMTVDRDTFSEIAPGLSSGTVRVAMSGVRTVADLMRYAGAGADAVIVGEELVTAANPREACRKLVAAGQHPACPSMN